MCEQSKFQKGKQWFRLTHPILLAFFHTPPELSSSHRTEITRMGAPGPAAANRSIPLTPGVVTSQVTCEDTIDYELFVGRSRVSTPQPSAEPCNPTDLVAQ